MPVSIRRPVVENIDRDGARSPDPAKIVSVIPVAVSIEIFCAPNVLIEILDVVFEFLRQIFLALAHPIVNSIPWAGCKKFPVAGVFAVDDEFSRTAIAQGKPGCV
jgi:hypothetical protein